MKKVSTLAIVGLVIEFIGIFFMGLIFSIAGVVLGICATVHACQPKNTQDSDKVIPIASLSIGVVELIVMLCTLSTALAA